MTTKLTMFLAALLISGCRTSSILVISEPPGARIEVEGDYIGDAPVSFTVPVAIGNTLLESYDVRAFPTEEGHSVQWKFLASDDKCPKRLFFDMKLRRRPDVEVDVNMR